MPKKTEKATEKGRNVQGGGLELSSNSPCLEKPSDVTPKKGSKNKSKKPEEPSVTGKKNTQVDVLENESRNSGANTASTSSSGVKTCAEGPQRRMMRSAVKQTGLDVALKEAKGLQETDQVLQGLNIKKRPDPPANKTVANNGTTEPQVKREKAQPESSSPKKPSVRKQPAQASANTSKPPTKATKSTTATNSSKQKKPAVEQLVSSNNKPLPKARSSQAKKAKYRATISKLTLNSSNYDENHIKWKGFEESSDRLEEPCCFCDKDIKVGPVMNTREEDFSAIPVVAFLPCGHIFHLGCLPAAEQHVREPPCFLCDRVRV